MMISVLGLPLEKAVSLLKAANVEGIDIKEISAPRGNTPRGTLRVVRVENGGKTITCARFPDTIEEKNDDE
ncbi:MAG: hypothetical protein IIW08_07065 [Clostridia bacterium]|nr:hypothetical protein [Clostridia bacterium]MBQ5770919.1 hypothetical protein [Clostridia bacterium]